MKGENPNTFLSYADPRSVQGETELAGGVREEKPREEESAQLEVSECTLPGPSVGEVTEEGVTASCHPPLA